MSDYDAQPTRFTIEEIAEYIAGWSMSEFGNVEKVGKATLLNALSQLRCDQDGIAAFTKSRKSLSSSSSDIG
jgi:hypothetical protein